MREALAQQLKTTMICFIHSVQYNTSKPHVPPCDSNVDIRKAVQSSVQSTDKHLSCDKAQVPWLEINIVHFVLAPTLFILPLTKACGSKSDMRKNDTQQAHVLVHTLAPAPPTPNGNPPSVKILIRRFNNWTQGSYITFGRRQEIKKIPGIQRDKVK